MEEIFKNINYYNHIVITLSKDVSINHIASANALYTYLLQQHKKVSLYCENNNFNMNIYFLPWMDKLKISYPSSADLSVNTIDSTELFSIFKENNIKLNRKMATSLYAGLLNETNGFKRDVTSKVFIMAKELIDSGAEVQKCTKYVLNYHSLSTVRFKAILLNKMILKDNATVALFDIYDEDLSCSGAKIQDVSVVIDEALSLPSIEEVIIKYNGKIIEKRMKFEKKK
ncbi:MAG: phosphoesterase [Campylobacterota bacterium]|nr:phosphoesterase [Campylobacterota bacterium]